jgi:MobA/MobL family
MADASYRLTTHHVARSANHNAVAGAAYQTGTRLRDERTGQLYDYSKRNDEIEDRAPRIVIPASERGALSECLSRQELWSLAELAEKRKDANPARVIVVSFAFGLGPEQRSGIMQEFAQWLADRHGVAVDYGIHRPDEDGDNRNFHGHMQMTTRKLQDSCLTEKSRLEWDGTKLNKERKRLTEAGNPGAAKLCSGRAMLYELREKFEEIENRWIREFNRQQEKIGDRDIAPIIEVTCKSRRRRRAAALKEALTELIKAAEARSEGKEGIAIEHEHAALMARIVAAELNQVKQPHMGKAASIERKHARMKAALAYEGSDAKMLRRKNRVIVEMARRGITELPEFATELGERRARVIRCNERRANRLARLRRAVEKVWETSRSIATAKAMQPEPMVVSRDKIWERIVARISGLPLSRARMEAEYIQDRARMNPMSAKKLWEQSPDGIQLLDLQRRMIEHVNRMNVLSSQIDKQPAGLFGRSRATQEMSGHYDRLDRIFRQMKADEQKLLLKWREMRPSFQRQADQHNARIAEAQEELPYIAELQASVKNLERQQRLKREQVQKREGEERRRQGRKPPERGR